MKAYRHKLTGRVVEMPDHLGDMFDYLEPVDSSEVVCVDCAIAIPEDEDEDEKQPTDELTEGN